jgi:hypothetical protein
MATNRAGGAPTAARALTGERIIRNADECQGLNRRSMASAPAATVGRTAWR